MIKKRIGSLLLCLLLTLSCLTGSVFAAQEECAVRGRVLQMILQAAQPYHPSLIASDIMKGDENGTREQDPVRRVEAMAMLSRAFGTLPEPNGMQRERGNCGASFSDLPAWAEGDLSNLTRAGIVAGYPDGRLGIDDPVTEEQLTALIRRVLAYLGERKQDDFYYALHHKWFASDPLPSDEYCCGTFAQVQEKTDACLEQIVLDMAEHPKKDGAQAVAGLYRSAMDTAERNRTGITPLKGYLEAMDRAKNVHELITAHVTACDELGDPNLLGITVSEDEIGDDGYLPYVCGASGILEPFYLIGEDENAKQAYLTYVAKILTLGGESADRAGEDALRLYEFERELALASGDYGTDPAEYETKYYLGDFCRLQDPALLQELLGGYAQSSVLILCDEPRIGKTLELLNEERLETLRAYCKFWVLENCSLFLTAEFDAAERAFAASLYGTEVQKADPGRAAFDLVRFYLPDALEEEYAARCCSEETVTAAENLVLQIRTAFEKRLEQADWLSEETRRKAIEKLKSMTVNIGCPDEFLPMFDGCSMDGTLFENVCMIQQIYALANLQMVGEQPGEYWPMYDFEVNAGYDPLQNSITIPAAMLQEPFFSLRAPIEQNLGALGTIVAHEVTHAFDGVGALYDADGRCRNWWTQEDRAAFERKQEQVAAFYDGRECDCFSHCDGVLTVNENIADLGAMACALDVLRTIGSSDVGLFFSSWAEVWKSCSTREYTACLANCDFHAPDALRVNLLVPQFEEFYTVFGVTETDAMYLPPDQRIALW